MLNKMFSNIVGKIRIYIIRISEVGYGHLLVNIYGVYGVLEVDGPGNI